VQGAFGDEDRQDGRSDDGGQQCGQQQAFYVPHKRTYNMVTGRVSKS
jgi:hypothetical protein